MATMISGGWRRLVALLPMLSGLVTLPVRAFDFVADCLERIALRRELSGFTDDALRDIGISRAELIEEMQKPFWRV